MKVKCDGNHGGPRCADPECWNDDPVPSAKKQNMHIETGHPVTADRAVVDASRVRFLIDDRCMFEVSIGDDGRSIEVRAVEMVKVDGRVYAAKLAVEPNVSNSVTIRTTEYQD